jgi:hypothetical protein
MQADVPAKNSSAAFLPKKPKSLMTWPSCHCGLTCVWPPPPPLLRGQHGMDILTRIVIRPAEAVTHENEEAVWLLFCQLLRLSATHASMLLKR